MKIRLMSYIAALAVILCTTSLSVFADQKVIAKIDGVAITEKDFLYAEIEIGQELANIPPGQRRLLILQYLIESQIQAKAAEENKIDKAPEFKDHLNYFRRRALQDAFYNKSIRQAVTDKQVKEFYDKQIASIKPQEEVRARHILVKTEKEAKDIAAELAKGTDFAKLASEKSTGPSKVKGGDLGYFTKDRMVKPFADAAFALKKGEVSKPVKSDFGWHVIKVEDKRKRPLPEFDSIKERLKASLVQQQAQVTIQSLRQKAKIDVLDKDLDKQMQQIRGSYSGQPQQQPTEEKKK